MRENNTLEEASSQENLASAAEAYRRSAAHHAKTVKNQLKVFLTTGLIVMSLIVVFIASAAWFANNKSVQGQGNLSAAERNTLTAGDYEIFKAHDAKGSSFERFMFGNVESISMNAFDAVINQNLYTAFYMRIPVESKDLGADNVSAIQYSIDCDDNAVWADSSAADTVTRYLSSIVQVKCYAFPSIDEGAEAAGNTAEYFYTEAQSAFADLHNAQQYVAITNDGPNYATRKLTFTIPHYNDTDKIGYKAERLADGTYKTYLYVEIDYSAPLIDRYLGSVNDHIELGHPINIDQFYQDMIVMELSAVKTDEA